MKVLWHSKGPTTLQEQATWTSRTILPQYGLPRKG